MNALIVARFTLKEAVRRRIVLGGGLLSVAFVGLFAAGFAIIYSQIGSNDSNPIEARVFAAVTLTIMGLYLVQFLGAFLAIFLSVSTVAPEAESGALHAVLARPISRTTWLAGRALGIGGLVLVYVGVMATLLLSVTWLVAGYAPIDPVRGVLLLELEMVLLIAAGLLASTVLPVLGAGVTLFTLFALSWMAGIVGVVGGALHNTSMVNLGTAVNLVFPSDAVWRGASFYVLTPNFLVQLGGGDSIPFSATTPPSALMLAWAAGEFLVLLALARAALKRKDL
jgi:ABC-type transport system involved in multi-copper enzyme maturation permease subunit